MRTQTRSHAVTKRERERKGEGGGMCVRARVCVYVCVRERTPVTAAQAGTCILDKVDQHTTMYMRARGSCACLCFNCCVSLCTHVLVHIQTFRQKAICSLRVFVCPKLGVFFIQFFSQNPRSYIPTLIPSHCRIPMSVAPVTTPPNLVHPTNAFP